MIVKTEIAPFSLESHDLRVEHSHSWVWSTMIPAQAACSRDASRGGRQPQGRVDRYVLDAQDAVRNRRDYGWLLNRSTRQVPSVSRMPNSSSVG